MKFKIFNLLLMSETNARALNLNNELRAAWLGQKRSSVEVALTTFSTISYLNQIYKPN